MLQFESMSLGRCVTYMSLSREVASFTDYVAGSSMWHGWRH